MPINDLLFDVLKRFAGTLAHTYHVADALYELTEYAVEVLTATSAGVSLADAGGALKFVTASSEAAAEIELVQQESRQGPCHQAYATATAVIVRDIVETTRWPIYRNKSQELGLRAVAGIPLTTGDRHLGAINVYDNQPRDWTPEDISTARVLADMATSYIVHASELAKGPTHQRAAATGAHLPHHHRTGKGPHRRRTRRARRRCLRAPPKALPSQQRIAQLDRRCRRAARAPPLTPAVVTH